MADSIYNYRRLLSERDFLKVANRAKVITDVDLLSVNANYNTILTKCNSTTRMGLVHTQELEIIDLSGMSLQERKAVMGSQNELIKQYRSALIENAKIPFNEQSLRRALDEAPLKIHCSCEAWLYWGYKYKAWRRGYGLYKELRFPKIRNPHLQGYLCKHLFAVLTIYPMLAERLLDAKRSQFMQK